MNEIEPQNGASPFDKIRQEDEHGEFWTGRDLQPLMDYARWHEFAAVIEKAKASLALVQGQDQANHHFGICHTDGGRWGKTRLDDYHLTRFAAYLTAMAGDDTKTAVAHARVYFAVKAREAEVGRPIPTALSLLLSVPTPMRWKLTTRGRRSWLARSCLRRRTAT